MEKKGKDEKNLYSSTITNHLKPTFLDGQDGILEFPLYKEGLLRKYSYEPSRIYFIIIISLGFY